MEKMGNAARKPEHESVGKSFGKSESVGKSENESVGKSVGKSENESAGKSVGKSENESVGKSVGKSENVGKSVGKSENESVGKAVRKSENESVGKSVGKSENEGVGKAVGKAENQGLGKVGKSEGESVGKSIGKAENSKPEASSHAKQEFVITVAGNLDVESLASSELKLPEGASLAAAKEGGEGAGEEEGDEFRVGVFLDLLTTQQFGRLLFHARQLPSTHTLLSQNCKVLPVGTLSVADAQFQGKGRAGNSWESPKGCLMFSFTVHMSDGRAVPFLQYVVSLAIIEGIEDHCTKKGLRAPDVRIKWPNDLYADGLKVGGVLCTSTYSSKKFNIVVGVGLNVGNRQPTTCLDALLEGINENAPALAKDELLATIVNQFEYLFEIFSAQGFSALESNYYSRWLHSGQTVVLEEKLEGSSELSHIPMKIQGLTPTGYLRAIDDASETYELHPDGNSFDFLKGLVRQKM